jgi:predicted nucleotidyltransferase
MIEGFAVENEDGGVFTVKGVIHPPDRVVAYLRYVPDPLGDRLRGGKRYRRVYRFDEQEHILRERWPAYLVDDLMSGIGLQAVPLRDIRHVHDPRVRLQNLMREGPADALEETALALVGVLEDASGLPSLALGLTGSLLVGLHKATSDVDLVVYGAQESRTLRRSLLRLLDVPRSPVRRPQGRELAAIHAAQSTYNPLSLSDFARLQRDKVNEGRFGDRSYFLRFVKRPDEVSERYGDPGYEPLGQASIRARVKDDSDAIFTPCRYGVGDVTFLQGDSRGDVREIVSFLGLFAEQAMAGDWVVARGRLELIVSGGASRSCRLIVGGQLGDYLLR